jgi:hypothetical protein
VVVDGGREVVVIVGIVVFAVDVVITVVGFILQT